jgi:hypothetical protein
LYDFEQLGLGHRKGLCGRRMVAGAGDACALTGGVGIGVEGPREDGADAEADADAGTDVGGGLRFLGGLAAGAAGARHGGRNGVGSGRTGVVVRPAAAVALQFLACREDQGGGDGTRVRGVFGNILRSHGTWAVVLGVVPGIGAKRCSAGGRQRSVHGVAEWETDAIKRNIECRSR